MGSKAHRSRNVEGDQDRLVALLAEALDEGFACARHRVPVDAAQLVSRHVRPRLVELHAPAAEGARVAAREEPGRLSTCAQDEDASSARQVGRGEIIATDHALPQGTSTDARTASTTASGVIPSASAS